MIFELLDGEEISIVKDLNIDFKRGSAPLL
jgi:hypothetical protein